MKFLIDAQLPKSLKETFISAGFDAIHSLDLPKENRSTDNEILEISEREMRTVITKDLDFLHSFLIRKKPSSLILVKTGNIRNHTLLEIFRKNLFLLINMLERSNLVEIYNDEIIERF